MYACRGVQAPRIVIVRQQKSFFERSPYSSERNAVAVNLIINITQKQHVPELSENDSLGKGAQVELHLQDVRA